MGVKYYTYFDGPENYKNPNAYYSWGGSPGLLSKLGWYLRKRENELKEISISLYLFNNYYLHHYFKALANKGVKINVVSIPLEGYDNTKPKRISEHCDKTEKYYNTAITKYSAAKLVYSDFQKQKNENYKLFIFPHMFIRSQYVRPFSRGEMPYSLHIKNGFIQFKNDRAAIFLSSSNFAVRDLVKEENMTIIENDECLNIQTGSYFNHLIHNSIEYQNFNSNDNHFNYQIKSCTLSTSSDNIILAPFYKHSPEIAEINIKKLIDNAKQRIFISGQHISSYKYSILEKHLHKEVKTRKIKKTGFLFNVLQKSKEGVKVKIASQTFVDKNGYSNGCRRPGNTRAFQQFTFACSEHKNIELFVNDNLHNKFIIIDDQVIITTFNYTPTQFMYLPCVEIDNFEHIKGLQYKGIFAETGQMVVIRNTEVVNKYLHRFEEICDKKETYKHCF